MALNPAYAQQSTRKLPFALGYVYGTGDQVSTMTGFDGTTEACYVLGDGEWDGVVSFSPIDGWPFVPIGPLTSVISIRSPFNYLPSGSTEAYALAYYLHFHGGSYSAKGVPLNLQSVGPDQGSDSFYQYFPSVTPALNLSGLAYYFVRVANVTGAHYYGLPNGVLNPIGVWRSTRCRFFDASGNVTGYGFTTNPTWQMIETILRFQIKPQQPPLAGLTAAELRLFDWPAMVAHAARNAAVPAGTTGAPRFSGNCMFAADMKLGAMMETQLRNCRSYKRERDGVLSFVGDDARTSVFIASQRAVVPGSLNLKPKAVSGQPNIYVPQYRELNIPAVGQVATAVGDGTGLVTFTTVGSQPFFSEDYFAYSGSSDDADFKGDYQVGLYVDSTTGAQIAPPVANSFQSIYGPHVSSTATGGYLGTEQSRFKPYLPTAVQHRAAQKAFNQVSPGLANFPRPLKAFYDLGNNTFDQTNRLMQWMMIRDLGPDATPYVPPIVGTISLFMESIDAAGNCVAEVEPNDVITLDATVDPIFAGDYIVGSPITDNETQSAQNGGGKSGVREFALQTYQPTAFVDVSMPPGDIYQTLTGLAYPTADVPLSNYFYLMQATPTGGLASDGTATITLPDLSVWWVGQATPTSHSGVSLTEVPIGVHIILYLHLTSFGGAAPTITCDSTNPHPPIPLAAGVVVLFAGTIAVGTLTGTGIRPLPHLSGGTGLSAATLVPEAGYYGVSATTGPPTPPTF